MKNILVVGANGMLGHDLVTVFKQKGYNVSKATRLDFDIIKEKEVETFFEGKSLDLVINSVAYTQVDKAEEEKELAFLVNEKGARNLAKATRKRDIPIVYISTDYVFDGTKNKPYRVDDVTNPINIYGKSKLAGEIATKEENPNSYIVRTSWLYGKHGKNFVYTMLELSKKLKEVRVVCDQLGSPTWTVDLARGIEKLFKETKEFGVYHMCSGGSVSWYEFAKEIFSISSVDIRVSPITTEEFVRAANRPKYSLLYSEDSLPKYNIGLSSFLKEI